MYNNDLVEQVIPLEHLFLDPNNPRFPDRKGRVQSRKYTETSVQASAREKMKSFGIRELSNSMLRNGFLPLDRIVVAEISENPGDFVVVEGNRRLTALLQLAEDIDNDQIDAEDLTEEYLDDLRDSIRQIPCLVYTGTDQDIAWILQGVRHLSGIKDWSPAQKAELVVKEIDDKGLKFGAVGEMLGLTAQQVGKYYRSYKALMQMKNDDDYQDRYDKSYFTLFDEAYSKTAVRQWLGWDDNEHRFTNKDNLHVFYSWISPDPENEDARRLHDPRQMRIFSRLVDDRHADLRQQVNDYEMTLEQAGQTIDGLGPVIDWRGQLARAADGLETIPLTAMVSEREELRGSLERLRQTIDEMLANIPAE